MKTNPWMRASLSAWSLGMEASAVIALRLMKIAEGGPAAALEARRMIDEKVTANLDLHAKAMTGRLGVTPHGVAEQTTAHYRRKVRANRRRLSAK